MGLRHSLYPFALLAIAGGCASAVAPQDPTADAARDAGVDAITRPDAVAEAAVDTSVDADSPPRCGFFPVPTSLPLSQCANECLTLWREGREPMILYDDATDDTRSIDTVVAVTDAFIAIMTYPRFGATGTDRQSHLLAFGPTGEGPTVIDSFDPTVNPYVAAVTTVGNTAMYYVVVTGTATATLRHWDATVGGIADTVSTAEPRSMRLIVRGDTYYLSSATGIVRGALTGASTRIVDTTPAWGLAVSSTHIAWVEHSGGTDSLRVASLPDGGAPRTLLTLPTFTDEMGDVVFMPDETSVLLAHASALSRVPIDGSAPSVLYRPTLQIATQTPFPLRMENGTLWFNETCAARPPDGEAPAETRMLDLATGAVRWLADDPHYPYLVHLITSVDAPTIRGAWSTSNGIYDLVVGQ